MEISHTEVEARLLDRALRPGATVLDAGCGRTSRLQAHRPQIARIVGLDRDEIALHANRTCDERVVGDLCQRLPFPDASFDLVYANFVVEHLNAPDHTFAEWHRVLRPGGGLVLLTPNVANPLLGASALVPRRPRVALKRIGAGVEESDVIPVRYRANTPWKLDRMLRARGFAPVEVHPVATLHRYAARLSPLSAALIVLERCLPANLRSTIVAWYAAQPLGASSSQGPCQLPNPAGSRSASAGPQVPGR